MIRHLQRKDIDVSLWDNCITNSINGLPYAYSWYLDTVTETWDALVLNDYEAVFPLTYRRKWGISYLYQPFFTQQLGVFSLSPVSGELMMQMLDNIPGRFKFIEINLNFANKVDHPDYTFSSRLNLELRLDKPYEEMKKGYSDNNRRNIQKAGRQGLNLNSDMEPKVGIDFFQKETGDKVESLKAKDYITLHNLASILVEKKMGKLYSVTGSGGEILATGLFVHSKNRVINLLPSASEAGKAAGASAFLLDGLINEYAGTHTIFDFEGSMIEGVARFYRGFGAIDVPYWQLHRKQLPWYLKILGYQDKRILM